MTADRPASVPVAPAPAATVLLVRDGTNGLEVLMMERHSKASFAGGATVFPGGRIEASDRLLIPHCPAAPEADLLPRIAAIREAFEECRILLAQSAPGAKLISEAEVAAFAKAHERAGDFLGAVEAQGLTLATDLLDPAAHWITPAESPKRFDTRFFIALAPEEQSPRHDGQEAVEARWMVPAVALEEANAGNRRLMVPTYVTLRQLAESPTAAAAIAAARARRLVTVLPERSKDGSAPRLPAEAGYDVSGLPIGSFRPGAS